MTSPTEVAAGAAAAGAAWGLATPACIANSAIVAAAPNSAILPFLIQVSLPLPPQLRCDSMRLAEGTRGDMRIASPDAPRKAVTIQRPGELYHVTFTVQASTNRPADREYRRKIDRC